MIDNDFTAVNIPENIVTEAQDSEVITSKSTKSIATDTAAHAISEIQETSAVNITIGEVSGVSLGTRVVVNHNASDPNQHTIGAITGLREELNDIKKLQTIYSNHKYHANYFMWEEIPANAVGLFVAACDGVDKIRVCTSEDDVFGVTVPTAAFIGGQSDIARDNSYGLVINAGLASVQCESDVAVGDYVVPNDRGQAQKADGTHGYLVTGLDILGDVQYAVISLTPSSILAQDMSNAVQDLTGRMGDAEQNIVSVGEVANSAYALAEDVREQSFLDIARLNQELNNTIDKVGILDVEVDELTNVINNTLVTAEEAKVIANNAVSAADSIRSTAVATANDALAEAKRTNASLEAYKTIIANVDAYTVGEYSQANGLTWKQAKDILEVDMIYVPVNEHTETYIDASEDYTQKFIRRCYYTWTGTIWNESNIGAVLFVENGAYVDGSLLSPYLVVENEDIVDNNGNVYKKDTLFVWQYNEESKEYSWVPITTISKNVMNRTVSLIRHETDSIGLEVTNVKGDVSALDVRVGETENLVTTVTTWKSSVEEDVSKIATIEQQASENESSIALVVSETDGEKVVNTASIVSAINKDGDSSVTIKADKINFEGYATFLSTDENGGITGIDGDGIITGTIAADKINIEDVIVVGNLAKTDDIPTEAEITTITENTITTTNVVAENLLVKAANVTGTLEANQINADGIEAEGVTVSGTITATAGAIGGCEIKDGVLQIKAANLTDTLTIGQLPESVAETSDIPTEVEITTITNNTISTTNVTATNLKVKAANIEDQLVATQINADGITAKDVDITGKITATEGNIGGCEIKDGVLQVSEANITSIDASTITAGTMQAGVIQSKNYVSGVSGLKLDLENGTADITGQITATSGTIGTKDAGFQINSTSISNGITSMEDTTNDGVYIGTDGINLGAGKFKVTDEGKLIASDVTLTGGIIKSDGYKPVAVISQEPWNENNKDPNKIYYVTYGDANLYYEHDGNKWSIGLNKNPQNGASINMSDGTFDSKNFQIDADGNVAITGNITATSGTIEAGEVLVNGILDACIIKTQGLVYDDGNNELDDPEGIYIDLTQKKHLYVGGKLVATSGEIGGFTLTSKQEVTTQDTDGSDITTTWSNKHMRAGENTSNITISGEEDGGYGVYKADSLVTPGAQSVGRITVGEMSIDMTDGTFADKGEKTFALLADGSLYAEAAQITGNITATSGTIGGCKIKDGVLQIAKANITSSVTKDLVNLVEVQYARSSSSTEFIATTEWSTTAPEWAEGEYMWQKTITTYADGHREESDLVCIQGAKGSKGDQLYTWIKYADDQYGLNMSDKPDGKSYMGIAYNKDSETESNVAADYTWTLVKGQDTMACYIDSSSGTSFEQATTGTTILTAYLYEGANEIDKDGNFTYTWYARSKDGVETEIGTGKTLTVAIKNVAGQSVYFIADDGNEENTAVLYLARLGIMVLNKGV